MGKITVKYGNHFEEEGFVSHAKFLPDEIYAQVLDSIVIACVDIALIDSDGEMLLGKRQVEPQADWWIIGGRMRPGESFEEAASRNVKRELGLTINPNRFHYLCTYSTVWAMRAQKPKANGSHSVSITMVLRVSDDEITRIQHNEEYAALQWMDVHRVANSSNFHPAVVMVAKNAGEYLCE